MDTQVSNQYALSGLIERSYGNFLKLGKDRTTVGTARSRLSNLHGYWEKFMKAHSELLATTTEDERGQSPYFRDDFFALVAKGLRSHLINLMNL